MNERTNKQTNRHVSNSITTTKRYKDGCVVVVGVSYKIVSSRKFFS
jgi:hypothetical protein